MPSLFEDSAGSSSNQKKSKKTISLSHATSVNMTDVETQFDAEIEFWRYNSDINGRIGSCQNCFKLN